MDSELQHVYMKQEWLEGIRGKIKDITVSFTFAEAIRDIKVIRLHYSILWSRELYVPHLILLSTMKF